MKSSLVNLCLIIAVGGVLAGCGDDSPAPTYTVSGTVSGLVGSGLVLANGGTSVGIGANGSFTLAGRFDAGASYAVTVATQPGSPAQICSVANGSGVVNANVSNVAVTCVTTPLASTGSTPADAAGDVARDVQPQLTFSAPLDPVTVAGHVTFTRGTQVVPATIGASGSTLTVAPGNPLSLATSYTVAVDTGLRGSSGEALAGPLALTFTTRDGVWHPTQVARDLAPYIGVVRLALTSDGNALAAWYENDAGRGNVWANIRTAGGDWGTPVLLETVDTGDAAQVQVAADGQGHAYVVWSQSDGTRTDTWMNRYTVGAGWSGRTQLSVPGLGVENFAPQVAANAAGDVAFAWVNNSNSDYAVWARILPAGGALGAPIRIESAAGTTGDVQVAMDAAGNATVLWLNYDVANNVVDLWANRHGSGGWEAGGIIENSSQNMSEYALGLGTGGDVYAIWTQQVTNSTMGVYTSRYVPGTGWSATTTLAVTTDGSVYYPKVAGDADGNALAVWATLDGSTFHESYAYYTAGGGWSTPAPAAGYVTMDIAFDASGNALGLWAEQLTSTNSVIKSSRFTPGAGFATPVELTPGATVYAQYPAFAIGAYGTALAAWIDYDLVGNTQGIVSSSFDDSPL